MRSNNYLTRNKITEERRYTEFYPIDKSFSSFHLKSYLCPYFFRNREKKRKKKMYLHLKMWWQIIHMYIYIHIWSTNAKSTHPITILLRIQSSLSPALNLASIPTSLILIEEIIVSLTLSSRFRKFSPTKGEIRGVFSVTIWYSYHHFVFVSQIDIPRSVCQWIISP